MPTLDELIMFEYVGGRKTINIISEASHKWKDIANLICGEINVTAVLERDYHNNPKECLEQTFIHYFISNKPQGYSQDWSGLVELLDDVGLISFAEEVKQAVLCIGGIYQFRISKFAHSVWKLLTTSISCS